MISNIQYKRLETIDEMHAAAKLIKSVWGDEGKISPFLFIAQSQVGGCLLGAFQHNKLIGINYGFIGKQNTEYFVYSHILAVDKEYQGYGIGEALKLKQKEIAIEEGLKKVVWTFDPLQSRNAYFNFHKLGAVCNQYKPNYYGEMENELNGGADSDRLIVEIHVDDLKRNRRDHTSVKYELEENGEIPVLKQWSIVTAPVISIPVPTDIQQMKRIDGTQVKRWQTFLKEMFTHYFSDGYNITNFEYKKGRPIQFYILEKD